MCLRDVVRRLQRVQVLQTNEVVGVQDIDLEPLSVEVDDLLFVGQHKQVVEFLSNNIYQT